MRSREPDGRKVALISSHPLGSPTFPRPTSRLRPGTCNYYDVSDGKGQVKAGGAWVYNDPKPAAKEIAKHVAFYPFVKHVRS